MPTTRLVYGNVETVAGRVVPGMEIYFRRTDLQAQAGNAILPFEESARVDIDGAFTIPLYPGIYSGRIIGSGVSVEFTYSLSENGSLNFADGIPAVSNIAITPSLVLEAEGYRDEAQAAAIATAADRIATGLDAAATAADRIATGLDRTQTGLDAAATAADRIATGQDRTQTGLDAAATAADRAAIETSLIVYVSDDSQSVTIAVSDTMVVTEGTSPYPTVTLEFATP